MKKNYQYMAILAAAAAMICLLLAVRGLWQQRDAGSEYETLTQTGEQAELSFEAAGQTGADTPEGVVSGTADGEASGKPYETASTESGENASSQQGATSGEENTETDIPEEPEDPLWTADEEPGIFETREDIDFEALQQRNPDVYAWIEVPGTKVDYPILQHPDDNGYYLNHTIDYEKKTSGAIYTENYNSKDFNDPHTVIYGHNMKNGTMFRSLHDYEDQQFFDENREVIIYLPDQTRYYEIYAAYTYDNRHLLLSYNLEDEEVYQSYLDEIRSVRDFGARIDRDVELTSADRIITLSTCVRSGDSTRRYLIQAVLVSIDH